MIETLLAAGFVMITSLVGVLFTIGTARAFLEQHLAFLVSFSAGVFLVTAGALTLEAFEIFDSLLVGAVVVGIGYVLAWGMHALLPETHHHHDPSCTHRHGGARKLIVGDGIHNIADGVILVTAFAVSPALGLAVTVSVLIHEALQEISEFFVLRQAGYSTKHALLINFAVSSTILIGVGLGYLALASHELEGVLLAVSAGFFLHVVLHDLLPKRHRPDNAMYFGYHVVLVLVGVILMGSVASALGDSHIHGDDDHGHEGHNEEHHSDEHADDHHEDVHEAEHHENEHEANELHVDTHEEAQHTDAVLHNDAV